MHEVEPSPSQVERIDKLSTQLEAALRIVELGLPDASGQGEKGLEGDIERIVARRLATLKSESPREGLLRFALREDDRPRPRPLATALAERPVLRRKEEPGRPKGPASAAPALRANRHQLEGRPRKLEGDTESFRIPDLLNILSVQGSNGVLEVTHGDECISVVIEDGHLVDAMWDPSPLGSRLGEILVEQGALDAGALEEFLAGHDSSLARLGHALAENELITEAQLKAALLEQTMRIFRRLLAVEQATFQFVEVVPEGLDRLLSLNVTELLLETARIQDESATGATERDPRG